MLFLCSASKYIIYYTLSQRHKHMLIKTIICSYYHVALQPLQSILPSGTVTYQEVL